MKNKLLFFCCLITLFSVTSSAQRGFIDPSFGDSGTIIQPADYYTSGGLLQPDDKYLIGGSYSILRFLKNGSADAEFGNKGLINTNPFSVTSLSSTNANNFIATADYIKQSRANIALLKYSSAGVPDSSFGTNGVSKFDFGEASQSVNSYVDKEGRIIVVGFIQLSLFYVSRSLIIRCLPDGSLDKTFGENGKLEFIFSDNSHFNDVLVQPDGKILACGVTGNIEPYKGLLIRLNEDGTADNTFGESGIVTSHLTDVGEGFGSMKLQRDNKIIVVGTSQTTRGTESNMLSARYNTDGSNDAGFGSKGFTLMTFDEGSYGGSFVLEKNDGIVISGGTYKGMIGNGKIHYTFALAGLTKDGLPDSSFGVNGRQITDFKNINATISHLFKQSDGKLIAAGNGNDNEGFNLIMCRYNDAPKQLGPLARMKRWIRNHTINWQYNAEVDYFVIEQSSNGVNDFKELAKVKAVNRQSLNVNDIYTYNLNDFANSQQLKANSKTYYRITAISNNSKVVSTVISDEDVISITISPNPVKDVLNISGLPVNQKTIINIVNRNGNIIQSAICNNSICNMNVSGLRSGLYSVQVNVNGRLQSVKFVKE